MASDEIHRRAIIRGKILFYLRRDLPERHTVPSLWEELACFGYHVYPTSLEWHINYLAEKGLVAVEQVHGPCSKAEIALVTITTRGIDYFDGLLPADEGIYIEPPGK
jgi:hypothetical protein